VIRVRVVAFSVVQLEKRDSLLVTETGVARRPLAHLELRHVPRYEVLDGLPDVRSAEDDRAHVREVEEPVQDVNW
jgi:hypothetical protein